ncbi:DUF2927 domain-containing protein [Ekhidna sp.]
MYSELNIYFNRTRTHRFLPILLAFIVFLSACSDDTTEIEATLSVSDFTTTLSDVPRDQQILGTLGTTTNQPNLVFDLISQSHDGALAINTTTGQITVADASIFDFEIISEISAEALVTTGDLSATAEIIIKLSKLSDYDLEVIDYFKNIALGFEFGSSSQITRRWETNMKIFIGGQSNSTLTSEVEKIVGQFNSLSTSGFQMEIVSNQSQSNFFVFFGSGDEYANIYPSSANLVSSNWGLFSIFWNGANQLTNGHMYVDIFRANQQEQLHLLREELTQATGLARDSEKYSNSIFQQSFSTKVTDYADIDEDIIKLLYHPDMRIGLNESNVDPLLREILISEN